MLDISNYFYIYLSFFGSFVKGKEFLWCMKGIYILDIRISRTITMNVGAVGERRFLRGRYLYIGSAQKNMEQRIRRHCSRDKKKHWHIDYVLLNPSASIDSVWLKEDAGKEQECKVASELRSIGTAVSGFGCSDCSCPSHFIRIESCDSLTCFGFVPLPI